MEMQGMPISSEGQTTAESKLLAGCAGTYMTLSPAGALSGILTENVLESVRQPPMYDSITWKLTPSS